MNARFRWWLALCGVAWLVAGAGSLPAQVVTYQVTGSFDPRNLKGQESAELFGITEFPATFSATFTFDLTQHPQVLFVPAGEMFDGVEAAHPFYAFPVASLLSMSLTTGSKTWTSADVVGYGWNGTAAAIAADTDLKTPPSLLQIHFEDGTGNVFRIGGMASGATIEMFNEVFTADGSTVGQAGGSFTISAVPEPSTYAAIAGACALAGVAVARRRRY